MRGFRLDSSKSTRVAESETTRARDFAPLHASHSSPGRIERLTGPVAPRRSRDADEPEQIKLKRDKASIESKLDLHITPSESCVKERRRLVARARAPRRQRCAREDQGAAAADARREPLAEHWCRQKGRPDRFGRKDDRGLGGVDRGLGSLLQYVRERSWN